MNLPSTYTLDTETIKLNAYRLLCLFYANKEIARRSDPEDRDDAASALERQFFSREMTQILLSTAIALRVLDDQMDALPAGNPRRQVYLRARDKVNRDYRCMAFDDLSLRETCSKIIHATTIEPHTQEGTESHKVDVYNWLGWSERKDQNDEDMGPEPAPIKWHHLSSNVRLGGLKSKEQWWHLLEVPIFVEAVHELLKD